MQIRLEASELPGSSCGPSAAVPGGYRNIHVGVQRKSRPDELADLVRGDAPSATWTLECTAVESPAGVDLKGPYIQGSPGGRFIYLSWVTIDDAGVETMFRRAKVFLDTIPPKVLKSSIHAGVLVGRLGLTDPKGHPLCAAVRPPLIEWSTTSLL